MQDDSIHMLNQLSNFPIGTVFCQGEGKIVGLNSKAYELLGLKQDTDITNSKNIFAHVESVNGVPLSEISLSIEALDELRKVSGRCEFHLVLPGNEDRFLKCELLSLPQTSILCFSNITEEVVAQKKLTHKSRLQDLMFRIVRGNLSSKNKQTKEQINESLQAIADFLSADHVCVYSYNRDYSSQKLEFDWHVDKYSDCCEVVSDHYFCSKHHLTEAHRAGDIWITHNEHCPLYCEKDCGMNKPSPMSTWFSAPIIQDGRCFGFLVCKHVNVVHSFSEDEIQLLKLYAGLLTSILDTSGSLDRVRLENLTNSSSHYVIRVNTQGLHTYWNRKFEEDFGWLYGGIEMSSSNALGSICAYDHEKTIAVVRECMMNPGKIVQVELDKPGKNGDIRTTLWEFVALTDEFGEPSELQCMGMDISENARMNKALKESEQRYRTLTESSDDAILLIGADGRIEYLNDTAANFYEISKEEAIGKNAFDLFPVNSAHDAANAVKQVLETKSVLKVEMPIEFKSGTFWFKNTLTPLLDTTGEIQSIMINASNITESKNFNLKLENSEKRYRTLFYDSGIPYLILVDNKFVDFNAAALELTGMKPEELRGADPFVLSPEFQPNGERTFEYSVAQFEKCMNDPKHEFECLHLRADGTPFMALASVKPVKYGDKDGMFVIWRDITKLKEAEYELELKERRLRELAEHSRTVVWETDKNGLITYISPTSALVLGYTPEQIIGKVTLYDLYDLSMAAKRQAEDAVIFSPSLVAFQYDAKLRHKTNDSVWVSRTITPLKDQHGIHIGFRGSDTDISERKNAEMEYEKFKVISDQSNHGNALAALDGTVLYVNEAFAGMHGYTAAEVTGKNISVFHTREQMQRVGLQFQKIADQGGFQAELVDHVHKDGTEFPGLMSAKLIYDENGAPLMTSATLIDIAELTKAQQEVRKLTVAIEQNPVPTIITDTDGNFVYVNPAFVETTGYERHEIYGVSTRILKSGQTSEDVYKAMWTKIKGGQVWSGEILNKRKNKELYWEHLTISPIFDSNGHIQNYLGIKDDITERKKTEQQILDLNASLEQKVEERTRELQESNEELLVAKESAEKANHAKSEFLSRMSHELRTPMNSILGFGQLLEMSPLEERQKKNVKQIITSGNHLLGLINEVLDISRIESGHITLSLEPLAITPLLSDCADVLRPYADKRGIQMQFNREDSKGVFVMADLQRTKQVMLNLMNNALKYNVDQGKVTVGIERLNNGTQDLIRIFVQDTGVGISENNLEKIFDPFERIGAEKGSIEGTGLGLSVVKQLVKLMNGEVGVSSVVGEGSKFWIDLPLTDATAGSGQGTGIMSASYSGLPHYKGKVLYVEDNPANVELVDQIISSQRPSVDLITDNTGLNIVQKAEVYMPDMILLDLNLPEIHGSEIIQQLKANVITAQIPVIVLSADALPSQIKNLRNLGAADYITKPLQVQRLIEVIDQYCSHSKN